MDPSSHASARRLRLLLAVCCAVVMLACAAKPQRSTVSDGPSQIAVSGAASEPATARLGQTITLSGGLGDNEVAVTVHSVKVHQQAPDATWIKPAKGAYVAIDVEIKVVKGKTYACGCDFALVAADGSLFEPVWGVGFAAAMPAVTLNSGEKTSGLVVFDVPDSAPKDAIVQLRPDWTNDVRGRWRF